MHWTYRKRPGHLQTPSPTKALKTVVATHRKERYRATAETTLAGDTPQSSHACNPSPLIQKVGEIVLHSKSPKITN
jgi:hypothetical protein